MTRSAPSASVRAEYAALAARYDRRWATYVERSLALLRPWMEGADLGSVLVGDLLVGGPVQRGDLGGRVAADASTNLPSVE